MWRCLSDTTHYHKWRIDYIKALVEARRKMPLNDIENPASRYFECIIRGIEPEVERVNGRQVY